MIHLKLTLLILLIIITGCSNQKPYGKPVLEPEIVLKNENNFTGYWRLLLNLSADFTGFDATGKEIPKATFLKEVGTGKYLPLRLNSDSILYFYKLSPINNPISDFTKLTLMGLGNETYKKYLWEGKPLPETNFKDLEGNIYSSQNMKGKTVVIDFWFIGCTACVHEMPKLNHLADSLKNKDFLFLSFAFDEEKDLNKFLKKTDFRFAVISDTSASLVKKLGVRSFPTQVVVDKNGVIKKVLDDPYHRWENLMAILSKM